MADYYPVLARAVSSLPSNTAQARRELYDRARSIVMDQLRRRDPDGLTAETAQERAALEAAIRRVETEARPLQARAENGRPQLSPSARPQPRTTRSAAKPNPKAGGRPAAAAASFTPAKRYLARILDALQGGDVTIGAADRTGRAKSGGGAAPPPSKAEQADKPLLPDGGELTAMLRSLATMMLALTYGVAAFAVTAVVYFRGSVMVAAGIIGYPVLLMTITLVICVFVIPPWALFRKAPALPAFGFLFRAIHSASRQAS